MGMRCFVSPRYYELKLIGSDKEGMLRFQGRRDGHVFAWAPLNFNVHFKSRRTSGGWTTAASVCAIEDIEDRAITITGINLVES